VKFAIGRIDWEQIEKGAQYRLVLPMSAPIRESPMICYTKSIAQIQLFASYLKRF